MRYSYMVQRHRRTLKKIGLMSIGALLCTIVAWRIDRDLSYAHNYSFIFDKRLSKDAQHAIAQVTEQLIKKEEAAPNELISHLHSQFNFVKKVAIFTLPGRRALAKIVTHQPLCLLGTTHALLSSGTTINRDLLAAETVAATPHVEVKDWFAGEKQIPSQLAPFLRALGKEKMQHFRVSWHGEHSVELTDIASPTFSLLIEGSNRVADELFVTGTSIKELLANRGLLNTPRKRHWTADMRFKKQVIVFAGKGERNGPRTF